ncbi:protein 5NUC-like [Culicoides brevitarsis]|uniref:protein 5NUC-like n=1 Tax=Culicoides brevitarsis TaxID=469753 RepID=UPI00307B4855
MTKIAFFSLFIALFVISGINAATITANKNQETFEFLLLHNNDMHGRFEETDEYTNDCPKEDKKANKCYGGFARVANVIRKHRQNAASGNGPPVLYLNAGDTYTGTPWFSLNKENITTEFLNALAPEAMCLGNHEFDFGLEHLAPHLKDLKFPILAANLNYSAVPELSSIEQLKKSTVLDVNGTKVGVIGYITPETNELSLVEYVDFTDEIEAINQEAALLRSQDVKIIIALGHSGIEKDLEIAEKCPLVDLVVGAHSHTYLGKKQDIEVPYGPYPMVVTQKNSKRKVPVVQAYAFTKYMGSLLLKFDTQGNLLSWSGTPLLLDNKIPKESDIEAMLEKYRPAIEEYGNLVIGYTAVLFDGHTCRYRECNFGNFITDAMVFQHAINYTSSSGEWTDAAIGMMQAGGIRGTIDENTNITKLNLNTVMPFEDRVTILDLMGQDIVEVLEHSVHRYDPIVRNGEFMQVSGLKIRYNVSKPVGQRVNHVEVRCASCRVPEYFPIQLNETYRVLMNEYPFHGGDGYTMLKNKPGNITKLIDIDNVIQYLARKTPVYLQRESRIVFEGNEDHLEENNCSVNSTASLIGVVKSTTLIVTIANLIIHFVQ